MGGPARLGRPRHGGADGRRRARGPAHPDRRADRPHPPPRRSRRRGPGRPARTPRAGPLPRYARRHPAALPRAPRRADDQGGGADHHPRPSGAGWSRSAPCTPTSCHARRTPARRTPTSGTLAARGGGPRSAHPLPPRLGSDQHTGAHRLDRRAAHPAHTGHPVGFATFLVVFAGVKAVARQRFRLLLTTLAVVTVWVVVGAGLVLALLRSWQLVLAGLLGVTAVGLLLLNLRELVGHPGRARPAPPHEPVPRVSAIPVGRRRPARLTVRPRASRPRSAPAVPRSGVTAVDREPVGRRRRGRAPPHPPRGHRRCTPQPACCRPEAWFVATWLRLRSDSLLAPALLHLTTLGERRGDRRVQLPAQGTRGRSTPPDRSRGRRCHGMPLPVVAGPSVVAGAACHERCGSPPIPRSR
jgi:hypothetical protein